LLKAPTPEALMRSRYTAYTQANIDYIVRTMCGPSAVDFDPIAVKKWTKSLRWVRLDVLSASTEGDKGEVSFKAFYTKKNKPYVLTEISLFEKIEGEWMYVNGAFMR
jgi:SEC-C motif-containing protein